MPSHRGEERAGAGARLSNTEEGRKRSHVTKQKFVLYSYDVLSNKPAYKKSNLAWHTQTVLTKKCTLDTVNLNYFLDPFQTYTGK